MFQRTQNINLSPIKTMELLASKIPDVVSLAQGIPSFDTPEIVKKAAIKALNRGVVAKYSLTYGLLELRETIEQKLAEDNMFYDFEKEIVAVAGSIEGITASLIAIIEPTKDEIIIFSPDYTSYAEAIKVAGGKPIYVNLMENSSIISKQANSESISSVTPAPRPSVVLPEGGETGGQKMNRLDSRLPASPAGGRGNDNGATGQRWQIDFNDLRAKLSSRTAAIMFSNPNNPTGAIFSKKDLLKIAELAESANAFIISDEVYKDFIYDSSGDEKYFSLAQIPELRKRIIRIFSLSKAYAMAGWRIGFLHSDEENVKEILKIHDSLVTCAPVIAQHAAMSALDFGDNEIKKFVKEFSERRKIMTDYLDQLSDFFSYEKPAGSYFIFPKIKFSAPHKRVLPSLSQKQIDSPSWQVALDFLYGARVAVVPGQAFGPAGENHLRLSFGRSQKDIKKGMERIIKYLQN